MTSAELKNKILSLGLDPTGKSVKQMKEMLALFLWAKNHPGEEFPEQFDPMLAQDASRADKDWVNENFKDTDWWIQEKINGMRSVCQIKPDGKVIMTSRERSVKDFTYTMHQDKVLSFQNIKSPFEKTVVLDGELIMKNPRVKLPSGVETTSTLQSTVAVTRLNTEQSIQVQKEYGSLTYKCFDILKLNGESTEDLPYEDRAALVDEVVAKLKEANPEMSIETITLVKEFKSPYEVFEQFIEQGSEGVMLKKRKAKYQQGKRSYDLVKLKGMVTVDAFITGFVPSDPTKGNKDLIGGFLFSLYLDGKLHEVAGVSNIPNDLRKEATILEDGKPTLNPVFYNRVAELVGQDFNEKSMRINSARINEWRPDKSPEECKLTKSELKFNGQKS